MTRMDPLGSIALGGSIKSVKHKECCLEGERRGKKTGDPINMTREYEE